MLTHASGHASFVNARAMEAAGLTEKTPDPAGGEILKDAERPADWVASRNRLGPRRPRARGVAREEDARAERLADARRQIELAVQASLEKGVTSFHDAGANFTTLDIYKQAAADGRLGIRSVGDGPRQQRQPARRSWRNTRRSGLNNNHLTIAAIKVTADGALGSRGALMLEPYTDSPSSAGLADQLAREHRGDGEDRARQRRAAVRARDRRSGQPRSAECLRARVPARVRRRRTCAGASSTRSTSIAADIPRFGQLGVIAAMQGIHATSDAPYVPARLGPKRARRGRLCVAEADEERRDHRQRHRRAGGAHRSDGEFPRHRSRARPRTARCSTATRR